MSLLSKLRLRHLRLVHAIAETGQISLAAERLTITQPAASRSLAEIEKLVAEPLFTRRAKGVVPTLIGEVVVRHAATVVSDLDRIALEIDAFQRGKAGVVRVGAVTGAAVGFVVPAVQKLKAEARSATVSVEVAPSVDLMEGLLRGDLDIALSRLSRDMDPGQFNIRPGRVEEIRYLVRAGHPLARHSHLTLEDLAQSNWIIQGAGTPIREAVAQAFRNRGLAMPTDTVDTSSLLVALSYLHETDAVAVVTREVLELLVAAGAGGWTTLDMRESLILSPYQLIRKRDRPMTPICARLFTLLEAEIAK